MLIAGDVYFMGSKIIDEVIKDLAKNHGLLKASVIILTGSSAGGTGVLLNLDRIQKLVHSLGSEAKVRGIIDSSWYLLRPETENEVRVSTLPMYVDGNLLAISLYCRLLVILGAHVPPWPP